MIFWPLGFQFLGCSHFYRVECLVISADRRNYETSYAQARPIMHDAAGCVEQHANEILWQRSELLARLIEFEKKRKLDWRAMQSLSSSIFPPSKTPFEVDILVFH